jgi:hypothetical protein
MRHAVFATSPELHRTRVTRWLDFDAVHNEWEALDNRRRAGEMPHVKFVEVRSSDDPAYNTAPYEPWNAKPESERPQWVTLSRSERQRLIKIGRDAGGLQDAADAMFDALLNDPTWGPQWAHLAAATISDYTWAAAHFCFPGESRYY